ncbi:MAG: HD domain-containing protein [Patescibacteria group bacterium]|nr:HD domain-containing protein [Patescibacteria group bacterium]MDE2015002.1 HD domain-containing protein [Patescibacteria group bacterium]MDE2226430.1 HD domain-containing protein [Patescibacteria group bacterium]
MNYDIPKEVKRIGKRLNEAGYDAHLVGGCVRDLLLGREPKDWDITTNAKPEEVQKLFSSFAGATEDKPATVYENDFGTVGIKTESEDPRLKVVEVTTYRIEGKYTDKRHPDEIKFAKTVEEDLARRDFTINALALDVVGKKSEIIDSFEGQDDLKDKIIRTVGNSEERFSEDALRLMRAVRFAVELDFQIEPSTRKAIEKLSGELEMIAKERIRDEFIKILNCPRAAQGIILLEELNLLRNVIPELREGINVGQNKHHIYTVFEHNVRALDYTAKQNYSTEVRLASLLHDVGKPKSKRGEGPDSTFYQHEYIGAKLATISLDRLHFPKEFSEKVAHLVRYHMFYYNTDEVSAAGVRRFLARVGPESVDELLQVREADRIGSGVPKAFPYKLRHLLFMIDKVKRDPISPKMLAVRGDDVMKILEVPPGPRVGWVLSVLLEEVLDEPKGNDKEKLEERVKELGSMSDNDLKKLAEKAKNRKDEFEDGVEEEIKEKHHVK